MRRLIPFFLLVLIALPACGFLPAAAPTVTPTATVPSATPRPSETPTPTITLTPTLGPGATTTSPVDGMTLVYVPAGPFLMGSTSGFGDEQPQHSVTLDAFWIDRTEVTNALYDQCVQAGACQRPRRNSSNVVDIYWANEQFANYPVIYVTWDDAQAYCQWAGRRLPTEAEWEKAARGADGATYPWGNQAPDKTLANYGHNLHDVTAVDAYPAGASPYGALDMAGNVMEWVVDWYSPDYYAHSPQANPTGPDSGDRRGLRGGSWIYQPNGIRAAYRYSQPSDFSDFEVGFRCVVNVAP
jgi:formylglycine-generating enzyme required for sulfatase activity